MSQQVALGNPRPTNKITLCSGYIAVNDRDERGKRTAFSLQLIKLHCENFIRIFGSFKANQ